MLNQSGTSVVCAGVTAAIHPSGLNTRAPAIIMHESKAKTREVDMDGEGFNNKERLVNDFRALMTDAEELLRVTASQAGEKIGAARQRIEQSLTEGRKALADAEQRVVTKSKECAEIADDYVRENPWSAVGMAAAVGLVFGLMIRRK
ncbi:MAG TPA: DUF883 family protein [Candidatus Binatia bacterium]|jgi:ElaB/YqjD/DUF883 family membrane-anchored ribosome-binding protein|nr:DUF883 family protein [Candidatus Binatia bacterium]